MKRYLEGTVNPFLNRKQENKTIHMFKKTGRSVNRAISESIYSFSYSGKEYVMRFCFGRDWLRGRELMGDEHRPAPLLFCRFHFNTISSNIRVNNASKRKMASDCLIDH